MVLILLAIGCGSSSVTGSDAGADSGSVAGSDAGPDAGAGTYALKISNVSNWCDISVNGTTTKAGSPPNLSYSAGTVVHLFGAPTSSSFVWGYWTGTDGATGSPAHDTKATTTVTMSADKNVTACCPFANGGGC